MDEPKPSLDDEVGRYHHHAISARADPGPGFDQAVFERIVADPGMDPARLAGFGDGPVEIEEVRRAGGLAIGVAPLEPECRVIDPWKRDRLLASGALVQVWVSYEFPAPGLRTGWPWHIVGADGILELDPYHEVTLAAGEGRTQLAQQPDFDPLDANDPIRLRAYAGQLEDLVAAIAEGREPYSSGLDGTHVIAMITAAELAATEQRTVEIDSDGTLR